jgi:hypothetical protein
MKVIAPSFVTMPTRVTPVSEGETILFGGIREYFVRPLFFDELHAMARVHFPAISQNPCPTARDSAK